MWLALDDADEGNGCVRFFRGSHHLGLQHQKPGEESVLYGRLSAQCGEPIPAPLRAGHASVHSDMTAHVSAGPNLSKRRRLGIAITYTRKFTSNAAVRINHPALDSSFLRDCL